MNLRSLHIVLLTLVLTNTSQMVLGQYFSVGNDPSGIKWRQIQHKDLSLVFPDYYEEEARKMILNSVQILPAVSSSLYIKPYSFKAFVHPESIISNGWTMWVPRKVELAPISSLYPMAEDYTDHLLIHEFRHIAQLDKMDQGLTRVLGWFLGDQASASVQALHVADWISEGDAVLAETLLSNSGRGRSPLFSQGMKSMMLDNYDLKFDKARFGSYKDFVPNHYVFGYHMVAMARVLDQDKFWSDMMDHAAMKPYRISSFNRFLRKRTGDWQGGLFLKTREYISSYWKENSVEIGSDQLEIIIVDSTDYFDYIKPYPETDSSYICLKKSYQEIPAFVRLFKNGKEEVIANSGSINDDSFSYSNGEICWAMQIADPRWDMRSFSDIFLFDINAGKKKRITRKQRYLYPVLSSDNSMIACIEERRDGSSHLFILDKEGSIIHTIESPDDETFRQPVWSSDNKTIYYLLSGREGKKLVKWDIVKGESQLIYDFTYKEVNQLALIQDQLIFTAPIGTSQGLYGYKLSDGSIQEVLVVKRGLAYPGVHNEALGISVFTSDGYRPAIVDLNENSWNSVQEVGDLSEPFISAIERTEKEKPINFIDQDTSSLLSTEYKKVDHLFNFHSWAPAFLDIDNTMIYPGVMIMSQNDLNTLESSFGIKHNKQHKSIDYFANVEYTGLYPKIGLNVLGGKRHADTLLLDRDTLTDFGYTDVATSATIDFPMFFSKGAYYQRIQPYFSLSHHRSFDATRENLPAVVLKTFNLSYAIATLGVAGQVLRRMSYRDLFPRWGFTSSVQAQAGIADPEVQALRRYSAYLRLYLPGLFKNHSLRAYAGYSNQNKFSMPQIPLVSLPRGHYEPANYSYSSYKVDYSFPLAYPDWAIPSFLYITRFKASLFTDGVYSTSIEDNWRLKTGIDLISNFYFLRINAEIEAGVRIIYDPLLSNPDESPWNFEFLYSFDLN